MKKKCACTLCESELTKDCLEPSFCQPCDITLIACKACGTSYSDKLAACPACKETNSEKSEN